jgi:hypothetical protein
MHQKQPPAKVAFSSPRPPISEPAAQAEVIPPAKSPVKRIKSIVPLKQIEQFPMALILIFHRKIGGVEILSPVAHGDTDDFNRSPVNPGA